VSLRAGRLPFQVQIVDSPATVTAHAGLPLVIEGFRALGLATAVREHVHFKQRLRGYPEAMCVPRSLAHDQTGHCAEPGRNQAPW